MAEKDEIEALEKRVEYFKEAYEKAEARIPEIEKELQAKEGKAIKVKMAMLGGAEDEPCICYFRTATTATKLKCIDLMIQSLTKAEDFYFKACILRDYSDPRVFMQDNDNDGYYLGALDWCGGQIKQATTFVKKK